MYNKRVLSLSAAVMLGLSAVVVPAVAPNTTLLPTASAQTAVINPASPFAMDHGNDVLNHLYGGTPRYPWTTNPFDSYQIARWSVEGFGTAPLPPFQMTAYTQINPDSFAPYPPDNKYGDVIRPGAYVSPLRITAFGGRQPFGDGTYIVDKNLVPIGGFPGTHFAGDGWINGLYKPVQELGARVRMSTDYAADVRMVMKVSDTHSKAEYVKSAEVFPWNGWWVQAPKPPFQADVSQLTTRYETGADGATYFIVEGHMPEKTWSSFQANFSIPAEVHDANPFPITSWALAGTYTDIQAYRPANTYSELSLYQGDEETVGKPAVANGLAVPGGTTYTAGEDVPEWATVNSDGTIKAAPGLDVVPRDYTFNVVVNYPDGTQVNTTATINVLKAIAPQNVEVTVAQGDVVTSDVPRGNNGEPLPEGTTYTYPTDLEDWIVPNGDGTVTARPGFEVAPGKTVVTVTASVPQEDGRVRDFTYDITVEVIKTPIVPVFSPITVIQGDTHTVDGPANGNDLPSGTTFGKASDTPSWVTVNEDGSISVIPTAETTPGLNTVPFQVTHPDGTVESVSMIINVINPNQPVYQPVQVIQGGEPVTANAPLNQDGTGLPSGTTFGRTDETQDWAEVNPDGTVTVEVGYETPVGAVNVPVLVTYPDGTSEVINAAVSIINDDAPRYAPVAVKQGSTGENAVTTEAPVDASGERLPGGTKFEIGPDAPAWVTGIDENTGELTLEPGTDVPAVPYAIPVIVTIPGGTTLTIEAPVFVYEAQPEVTQADENNPGYGTGTTQPGKPVVVEQNGDKDLPDGTTFGPGENFTKPEGWVIEIDSKTGDVSVTPPATAKPGDKVTIPVVITYPDGSTDTAEVTVVVTENPGGGGSADGSADGSSVSDRCVAAAATVGLPLLFLIPLGFATELNIPGLSPVITQVQSQIGQINAELQRNLGIFEPNTARFVQELNAQFNQYGKAVGGLALVAAGLLAGAYVFDNCVDGGSSSSSSSSSSDDVATAEDSDASSDSSDSSSLSSE
ncbi:Rib/alpha-like domain-containing protein [Corynebacterium sp. LK2510]|uniref:Rib/alpha-like domain-containing protein n=1 Tax=Corynebacterium sp. LK2510 TaxID=3110472 RepID=UPI0034CFDDC4